MEIRKRARIGKDQYYLGIAAAVMERSTCLRRRYGAVIVKDDEIISTGYNGAPRGRQNCNDLGQCYREAHKIPSGERYELCRSVHAEANAIISASRKDTIGSKMYLIGAEGGSPEILSHVDSCSMCKRLIINAGIKTVITESRDPETKEPIITEIDVEEKWVKNDDSLPEAF